MMLSTRSFISRMFLWWDCGECVRAKCKQYYDIGAMCWLSYCLLVFTVKVNTRLWYCGKRFFGLYRYTHGNDWSETIPQDTLPHGLHGLNSVFLLTNFEACGAKCPVIKPFYSSIFRPLHVLSTLYITLF